MLYSLIAWHPQNTSSNTGIFKLNKKKNYNKQKDIMLFII